MKRYLIVSVLFLASCMKEVESPNTPPSRIEEHPGDSLVVDVFPINNGAPTIMGADYGMLEKIEESLEIDSSGIYREQVLLLDIDGYDTYETNWNWSLDTIHHAPVSAALMSKKIDLLNRVRLRLNHFPILVTMNQEYFDRVPEGKRMRIVISPTWEWYGYVGGVAYTNSWKWANNTAAYVFSGLLGDNVSLIAQAALHEFGHTVGMRHQSLYDSTGKKLNEYNPGTPERGIIMGGLRSDLVAHWNIGWTPYHTVQYDGRILEAVIGKRAFYVKTEKD